MPRQRRLNVPGVLHHVIARGLERRAIFLDDRDRLEFLLRLGAGLRKEGCRCYAWVLMPNHFHLLVRTSNHPLSSLMRRLMTGYAVFFNRRHHRTGYLFQNRYKSILCQEEAYFLELVRYIHLNPVRAKLVKKPQELEAFPWSGHAALTGTRRVDWQKTGEVLSRFSEREEAAIERYRAFVGKAWGMGKREDLTGGGLLRSVGGWEPLKKRRREGDYQRGDERILGDGDFVEGILQASNETLVESARLLKAGWTWAKLVQQACRRAGIPPSDLMKKGRGNSISKAKELLAAAGVRKLGMKQKEVAERLGVTQGALSQILRRAGENAGDVILLTKDRPPIMPDSFVVGK